MPLLLAHPAERGLNRLRHAGEGQDREMQCPQCGAENSDTATFCSLCYAKFARSAEPAAHRAELGPPSVTILQGESSAASQLPPEPPRPEPPSEVATPTEPDPFALSDSPGARLIREAVELLEAGMPEAAFSGFEGAFKAYQSEGVVSSAASEAISNGFAKSLIAQGRHKDAAPHYLNVVRIKSARLGMASPALAADWNRIGDTMLAGEMYEDAEQMYGLALKLDASAADRLHSLSKQAACYDALDRPADAQMARQKAEKYAR